jgi:hypothetical protein
MSKLGFVTGIPWVGFSDTVPVQPWVRYPQVTGTVFGETHGTRGTHGFLVLFYIAIY